MITKPKTEAIILDIRKIRQATGRTMPEMGALIALLSQGLPYNPIPHTRVNEWEGNCRPIPNYVYTATANILLDDWSCDRHSTSAPLQSEVDIYYGTALNESLGELFRLEHELSQSNDEKLRSVVENVKKARITQMRYLEALLNVSMAYVFAPAAKFGCCELEDVV